MRLLIVGLSVLFFISLSAQGQADEAVKSLSYEEIQHSTQQLEKDWDSMRHEYASKFKVQMDLVSKRIDEMKSALDNGDASRRKQINDEMTRLKESRDSLRQAIHEITATSIVKLSAVQKYFKNAKDDTKD